MPRKKFIKIPIFNQRIYLSTRENAEQCSGCPDLDLYNAVCYRDNEDRICFYYSELSDKILVHESIHLANFIIDRCLIYSTPKQDEILAYLATYIYEELKKIVKP